MAAKLNRRSFMQLLGLGATAAVLESRLVEVLETKPPPSAPTSSAPRASAPKLIHRTRLSLTHPRENGSVRHLPFFSTREYQTTGFYVPVPAGHPCRIEIYPEQPLSDDAKGSGNTLVAIPRLMLTRNEPAEVIIDAVRSGTDPDRQPMTASPMDAYVLNAMDTLGCPVDWGVVTDDNPLVIDHHACGNEDTALMFALTYQLDGYSKSWAIPIPVPTA